ncbi:hypothetical protein [Bacillus tequilensis]|uniref:Uncharacterized protein n=1 Tax=Bacillus tequilensis TaxID=227866 RepID=A0A6H0WN46_9BACI|nr:hypothetical protein [Bacillus tequilensis]QIW80115.1 hypothetical protein G4P54_10015 [Bacillus tequilensis]
MKKFFVLVFTTLLTFVIFGSSASAATTGSVTAYRSDNAAKEITLTGAGKYMKFTCTYHGKAGESGVGSEDAYCDLYKLTNRSTMEEVASFYVDSRNKSKSTDVWLDKNATYLLKADANLFSHKDAYVTATIQNR